MNAAVMSCVVGLSVSALSVSLAQPGSAPGPMDGFDAKPAQFGHDSGSRVDAPREGRRGPGAERGGKRGGERGGAVRERLLEEFDADGDGTLSDAEKEAARAQREARQAERAQERAGRALERFDADGNGALDASELAAMFDEAPRRGQRGERGPRGQLGGKRGGEPGARLQRMLTPDQIAQFDADGDGKISRDEAQESRDELRAIAQKKRDETVARFDTDGDGDLSREEREGARAALRQERRVLRADENKNGVLDTDELEKALELIRSQSPEADFNGDGSVDTDDMTLLLNTLPSL